MVHFATTTTCLAIARALPLWVPCTTTFAVLYHLFLIPISLSLPSIAMFLLVSSELNSFVSFILSSTSFCTIWASSLCAHINSWLLLTLLVCFKTVNSPIISSIMISSSKALITLFCLLSIIFFLLTVQCFFTHACPSSLKQTHDSFFYICRIAIIGLLDYGLVWISHLMWKTALFLFCMFLSQDLGSLINCKPPLSNQFLIMGTFLPQSICAFSFEVCLWLQFQN